MRDKLPKTIPVNKSIIINLDESSGKGTHWVAFYRLKDKGLYFDSFGLPPPEELLKKIKVQIYGNSSQLQHDLSVLCGYYCVDFIERMDRGEDHYDILYSFDQYPSMRNEQIVSKKFV